MKAGIEELLDATACLSAVFFRFFLKRYSELPPLNARFWGDRETNSEREKHTIPLERSSFEASAIVIDERWGKAEGDD